MGVIREGLQHGGAVRGCLGETVEANASGFVQLDDHRRLGWLRTGGEFLEFALGGASLLELPARVELLRCPRLAESHADRPVRLALHRQDYRPALIGRRAHGRGSYAGLRGLPA